MDALAPDMAALLGVLRGEAPHVLAPEAWQRVLALAEEHGVQPLVVERLLAYGRGCDESDETQVPFGNDKQREGRQEDDTLATKALNDEELRGWLEAASRANRLAGFWWTQELREVLLGFAATGVEAILLKGPHFAERVYGGVERRECIDLDVLIRTAEMPLARAALGRLGFSLTQEDNGYHEQWQRKGTIVELHREVTPTALFRFPVEGAWQASVPAVFAGGQARRLSAMDELAYTCLHGVKHGMHALRQVLDVALSMRRTEAEGSLRANDLRPELARLRGVLYVGMELARRMMPTPGFDTGLSRRQRRRLDKLVDAHWERMTRKGAAPLRSFGLHRLHREVRLGWVARTWRLKADAQHALHMVLLSDEANAKRIGAEHGLAWLVTGVNRLGRRRRESG